MYSLSEQYYSSQPDLVRNVHVTFDDSVMSIVSLEKQFEDIERFCLCEDSSVLGIDPTFKFWVASMLLLLFTNTDFS